MLGKMQFWPTRFRTQTFFRPACGQIKILRGFTARWGWLDSTSFSASRCLQKENICLSSPSSHPCILGMHRWRSEVCVFTFPPTAKCCDLCTHLIWTSPLVYSDNLSAQRMSVRLGIKDSCLQSLAVIPRSSESVWGLLTSLQWHTLKFLLGSPSIYETSISIFSPYHFLLITLERAAHRSK